jgi:phosphoglycolate phosphatase
MKYTTVLWDLDGTIIDSSEGIFESFRHTFTALGLPDYSEEQLRKFLGPPLRDSFREITGGDDQQVEECIRTYREFYLGNQAALKAKVYPGILDVIKASREAGAKNSLATSKALSGTTLVGEHFNFLDLFDFLGTASNDAKRLTKIDVMTYALTCLRELGADLESVVLVGDRIHDVEGARHHGVDVILAEWGFGDQAEWSQADASASSPEHLAELLGLA